MQETGERASAVSCKRLRSEQSTPSPSSTAQLGKGPKIAVDQRTFAQTTSGLVRVAMVPMEYPERRLDDKEAALLEEKGRRSILSIAMGTKAPTFKGTSDRDGAVIFNCTDIETEGWLRSLTSAIDLNGVRLRALRLDELPRRHRVVVHVEDPKMPVKEAIELLDRQNKGLQAANWVVARGSESRDAASTHFAALIGEGALRALKALNFKPFCGLGQATVKLPGGDRGGASSKKKDETGTV
ncbi:uncharacterized protein [Temnothorax nylanderi]|uniref:uncharacterized protein n=1 Tax=Temnothorax nylanderi TaxID=102681 RepID=UPI003A868DA7